MKTAYATLAEAQAAMPYAGITVRLALLGYSKLLIIFELPVLVMSLRSGIEMK